MRTDCWNVCFHELPDQPLHLGFVQRCVDFYRRVTRNRCRNLSLERFNIHDLGLTLKAIGDAQRADATETSANPRARSAVLRVAEKLGVAA